jgi:dihydroorotase/N-acyl-D-amino-acid deacylase
MGQKTSRCTPARLALLTIISFASASVQAQTTAQAFDLVLANGHIVDGSGSPWYQGDIGIRDGKIMAIGKLDQRVTKRRIDVAGKVIAPGFIDMLGQSELTVLVEPRLPSKIYQGITTEITGEGNSIAPLAGHALDELQAALTHYGIKADWQTLDQYYARLERQKIGINVGSYVGATTIRSVVIGGDNRPPTPTELIRMRTLVKEAMLDGAMGLSSSLEYAPAPYASTEELIALAKEAGQLGGIYATHMRSEGDAINASLDEVFRIAQDASIPVEIWHLKIAGKANWGTMPAIVARINAARANGLDITADTYAYPAWFNDMSAFVPPWAHDGGTVQLIERLKDPTSRARIRADMLKPSTTWDNEWSEVEGPESILVGVVHNQSLSALQGQTIAQIAKERGTDPLDTLLNILIEDNGNTACAVFGMNEADVAVALKQPWTSADNDSSGSATDGPLAKEHPHPRAYGTFPRILRKYVREEHLLSLEDAIRKFTALPAARMHLTDRGLIKQGLAADLVVFDPLTVIDRATFAAPNQLSEGMQWVLVNGIPVIDGGQMTGALPGHVLRGPGYQPSRPHTKTLP